MTRFGNYSVQTAVAGLFVLAAAGCGPKPYDIEHPNAAASAGGTTAAAASTPAYTKPLLSAANDHLAPGAGKPDLDRAETDAASHPNDLAANQAAAFTYYKLQAFAQAIPAFQKVIALAPDDVPAHLFLGYSQMAYGALEDAVATFQKVPDLKNVSRPDISTAFLEIGSCDWALERYDPAAEAFSRSLGANTHQGMASLGLGTYAAMKGRTLQARDFFVDAAKDLPPGRHRANAYDCLGLLSENNKDFKGALTHYRAAIGQDPADKRANAALARLSSVHGSKTHG